MFVPEGKHRVFLAMPTSLEERRAILSVQEQVKPYFPGLHWIPEDNLHITLQFFGEVGQQRLGQICHQLPSLVNGIEPFTLELYAIGFFGSLHVPRVLYLKQRDLPEAMKQLTRRVYIAFAAPDERSFRAHLTIGKFNNKLGYDYSEALSNIACDDPISYARFTPIPWEINRVVLYESIFEGRAVRYEEAISVPLLG